MATRKFQNTPPFNGKNNAQVLSALVDTVTFITAQAQDAIDPLTDTATFPQITDKINEIIARLQGITAPAKSAGRPGFLAGSHNAAAVGTYVAWGTLFNMVGAVFDGTTFTAPVSGVYMINSSVLTVSGTAGRYDTYIHKNGSALPNLNGSLFYQDTGGYHNVTQNIPNLLLAAGDTIKIKYESGPGTLYAGTGWGHFGVQLVG